MNFTILIISIFFQLLAIIFAIRLIRITEKYLAWMFIVFAIILMIIRRVISLSYMHVHDDSVRAISYAEYTALAVSILFSVGLYLLTPIFKSIKDSETHLKNKNKLISEAKEEAELNKENYKSLFNSIRDAILVTDSNRNIIDCNDALLTMFGYNYNEIIGNNTNVLFKDDQQYIKLGESLKDIKIASTPTLKIIEFKKKNNTKFIGEVNINNFEYKDGIIGVIRDITKQNKIQQDLLKLKLAIEKSTNEVYIFDAKNLKFSYVNYGAINNLGYSSNELKKMTPLSFKPEFTLENFTNTLLPLKNGEIENLQFETIHQRKDSSTYPTEVNLSTFVLNNKLHYLALIIDISERKKTEQKIAKQNLEINIAKEKAEKSEQRYELAIAATNLGIWDWDAVENTMYFSSVLKAQIGYKEDELESTVNMWEEHLHPDEYDVLLNRNEKYLKNPKGTYVSEFRFRHKNGSYIWIHSRAEVLKNEKGEIIRMLGSHRDITALKKAEKKLIATYEKAKESDRLKSVFLATMSHELRTPLNAIIGLSSLVDKSLPLDDILEFNSIINSSGNHLLNLVEDIFDISMIESGELKIVKENVKLQSILNNVHEIIKSEREKLNKKNTSLNLKTATKHKDLILNTDPTRLKQILINLIKNALKFTEKGSINYGYNIKTHNGKSMLEFYIKDTGIGITKDKLKFIFEMFRQVDDSYTRAHDGAGIGLYTSKKLIELLGGTIWVNSEIQKGSAFYFTIPFKTLNSKKNE